MRPMTANHFRTLHQFLLSLALGMTLWEQPVAAPVATAAAPVTATGTNGTNSSNSSSSSGSSSAASCTSGTGNPANSCASAGNPINLITGNKYQRDVDLPALPGVLGLEIVRHYNSLFAMPGVPNGVLGRGWRLSYEVDLYVVGSTIQIVEPDGHRVIFSRDPLNPSRCSTPDPANGSIATRHTDRGEAYLWTRGDGAVWDFNEQKKLMQIRVLTGEAVNLQYDPDGLLMQVTDPQGRRLQLTYLDRAAARSRTRFSGVQSIISPVGRFEYAYGSALPKGATLNPVMTIANLVKVTAPVSTAINRDGESSGDSGSNARLYHYDDPQHPTLLTGISIADTTTTTTTGKPVIQRLATFAYQADGRAILSTHANDIDRVTLRYPERGTAILTNSLGQTTVYRHADIAGEYRLLEARGPGCRLCDAANVRYSYDKLGRPIDVTRLTDDGAPIQTMHTTRDYVGRPLTVGTITYSKGKPGPLIPQRRYEYGPGTTGLPTLIARPSVVAGREMQTRITYNAAHQPLTVTDTGWAPALATGAALTKTATTKITTTKITTTTSAIAPTPAPTLIERTTTYRYAELHRRSVLVQIDGPLANGPSNSPVDSDITTFQYDASGSFVAEIVAPGKRRTRTSRDPATGYPVAVETDDSINSVQRITVTNNLQGQPERIVRFLNATTAASSSGQDGTRKGLVSRLLDWFSKKDANTPAGQLTTYIAYDALGHPQRITRPDGSWIETFTDAGGRPTGLRDQDGNTVSQQLDSESRLLKALRHSTDPSAPLDATTAFQYDAQSRLAQVTDPANAITHYNYDAAGQLTAVTDALQRHTRFDYDTDARLIALVQNAGTPEAAITKAGFIAGADTINSLTAANGATTRSQIDDFGRTLVIDSPDSGRQVAHYDAADRITDRIDANGNRTEYRWDVAGRLITSTTSGQDSNAQLATQQVTYRYQGNQLIGVADAQQTTELHYDANGNIIKKIEHLARAGDDKIKDASNQQIENKKPALKFTTRYHYDALNRVDATTLASGETVRITYGKASRPQRIDLVSTDGSLTRPLATDIQIHPFTGLVGFTHGNGLTTRYERNRSSGQLVSVKVGTSLQDNSASQALISLLPSAHAADDKSSHQSVSNATGNSVTSDRTPAQLLRKVLYAQHLDYDVVGRITGITRSRVGQTEPANEKYDYDNQDRLSKVNAPMEQAAWRYDGVGNRLSENRDQSTEKNAAQTLTYQPASNRLTTVAEAGNTITYTYDPTGNPTQIGDRSYLYGVTGRLEQVSEGNKVIARYAYNAHGERISKTVFDAAGKSTTTYFLYYGNQLDAEVDAAGQITTHYLYFKHAPVTKLEYGIQRGIDRDFFAIVKRWIGVHDKAADSKLFAIHTDHLGTPQLATDAKQQPVWQARYTAFGKASVSIERITLNLRLPGQYFDGETDAHYNLHRDYDALTGRYLTSDPIALAGGINTYTYATNDPLEFIDPYGLKVYVQSHTVLNAGGPNNFGHLSILLIPDDQQAFANKSGFMLGNSTSGIAENKWYRVISAGPTPTFPSQNSSLTGMENKSTDIPGVNNNIESEVIANTSLRYGNLCIKSLPTDKKLIEYLISLAGSYNNSLKYSYPSLITHELIKGQYNSNSYVKGILGFSDLSWSLNGNFGRIYPGLINSIPDSVLSAPNY